VKSAVVVRLMTSSNSVGACTGSWPGFAPRRMRSGGFPARASSARTTSSGLRGGPDRRHAERQCRGFNGAQVAFNRPIRIEDDGNAIEARCDLLSNSTHLPAIEA
jgi:hypothetical protein